MTLAELSAIIGVSEYTIKNQFKRTQERYAKKGIFINKTGRAENVDYTIDGEIKEKKEKPKKKKALPHIACIYALVYEGKVIYIGQTKDLGYILTKYKMYIEDPNNKAFKYEYIRNNCDINKIEYKVLEEIDDNEERSEKEKIYIQQYRPICNRRKVKSKINDFQEEAWRDYYESGAYEKDVEDFV